MEIILAVNAMVVRLFYHMYIEYTYTFFNTEFFLYLIRVSLVDPCDSSPCKNGATCESSEGNFTCKCTERFVGPSCSKKGTSDEWSWWNWMTVKKKAVKFCKVLQHRNSTSQFNIVECNMLDYFCRHFAWCMMLNEVWFPSNISCNIAQYFFCSRVSTNKVALVWPRTLTLLRSSTRSKSSLRQGQQVVSPKIRDHYSSQISSLPDSSLYRTTCCSRLATQSNTIQQSWILSVWSGCYSFPWKIGGTCEYPKYKFTYKWTKRLWGATCTETGFINYSLSIRMLFIIFIRSFLQSMLR